MKKKNGWIILALSIVLVFMMSTLAMGATSGKVLAGTRKNGWNSDKTSYFKNGKMYVGLRTIDGKKYFFDGQGKIVKSKRVLKVWINKKPGYYRIASNGVVTQWTDTAELAAKALYSIGATKKTTYALKKAFLWSAENIKYMNNTKSGLTGSKAAKYYGDFGFKNKRGDCTTQAYTFYWMAKVLGYSPKVIRGYVPTALKNGQPSAFKSHAWVEIKESSGIFVYDPTFNSSTDAKALKASNKYVGFHFIYGTPKTYRYYDSKKKALASK